MARFGLVGGSAQSQSPNADCQRSLNWYVERLESGAGKSDAVLYPVPNTFAYAQFESSTNQAGIPVRGQCTVNGRSFGVTDTKFSEVDFASGSVPLGFIHRGNLTVPAVAPVSFAVSNAEILICAEGLLYVFNFATNVFSAIPPATMSGVLTVGYSDGYFVAVIANTNQFRLSALLDATSWDPADVFAISEFVGNIVGMIIDHRELWMFGEKQTLPYYNAGDLDNPFQPVPSGFIEEGLAATNSTVQMDNTIFWLGGDTRGQGIAYRAQGYLPIRISTHAEEFQWSKYATIADAIGFTYQDQGHTFYCLYFPTAGATWVYDAATQLWHEQAREIIADGGLPIPFFYRNHVFVNGKHVFGRTDTPITDYLLNPSILDQSLGGTDPNVMIRERISPHISIENQWLYHSELIIDLECGLGTETIHHGDVHHPIPDTYEPVKVMLSWSDDGGHTFKTEYDLPAGMTGQYTARCRMTRLGRSRDRVYKIRCSDPIPWRIIDAYVIASPGFEREERLSSKLRKSA